MDANSEVKAIKMLSIFYIIIICIYLAFVFYYFFLPYVTIKGHNMPLFNYIKMIYQEMPLNIIALSAICVIQLSLLGTFFGIFQLSEKARKVLIFISSAGVIVCILIFIYSKIIGQKLSPPFKEILILCSLLYFFTRSRIRGRFK